MADIVIPIESIKKGFDDFLETKDNSRVFFSGKFGIGKTHFLKDFFYSHNNKYDVFHLFPLNYQINSTEDIFELVKYDILLELLKLDKEMFAEKEVKGIKESSLLFFSWCNNNLSINSALKAGISVGESFSSLTGDPLLSFLGKLGRPLKDLLDVDKEFQAFKKDYEKGEKGKAEKYIESIREKNINEPDYISYLLKEKINQHKGTKKSILILDDLDRVDPEHIFRLLNILSAYFERYRENEFGFDIVVIVADYVNIKNIFHHRYGKEADFPGYMDKFFTIAPYYFDNKRAILDTVDQIAKSVKSEEPNLTNAIGNNGYIQLFLRHVFSKAIDVEEMNLRELLKATKYQLTELKKGSFREDHFNDQFRSIFDKAVKIAIHSFSSIDAFINKINRLKTRQTKRAGKLPCGKYNETMLRALGKKIPEKATDHLTWEKYTVTKDQSGYDGVKEIGSRDEALFYDLLIEYIREKRYENDGYED